MESEPPPNEIRVNREYSVLMKILEEELAIVDRNQSHLAAQAVRRIIKRFKQAYGDDDGI